MRRGTMWLTTAAAVALLWALVGGVAWISRALETTPASVLAYLDEHPLDGLQGAERAAAIEGLASRVNRLAPADRMDRGLGEALRDRFRDLTEAERSRYLELTLPRGFEQAMEVINAMSREDRQQLVSDALREIERDAGGRPEELTDAQTQAIVDEGMKSFLRDASAEAKLDLQPLVSRMQQELRRHR